MGRFTIDLSWDAFARLMMLNYKIEGQIFLHIVTPLLPKIKRSIIKYSKDLRSKPNPRL